MPLHLKNLLEIIDTKDFNRLIGEVESQFLDVKSQPYQFDARLDAKREFAKDVAAFANADGGYILIGVATEASPLHIGEEITELRPVGRSLFDSQRHQKLLAEWLYPLPKGIDVKFVPFGTDTNKGIGVVFVSPQDERSKPFLITRSQNEKKSTELLIGYVERHRDQTHVRKVAEIHQALRTGLNLERELLGRIANIEFLLEQHLSYKTQAETLEKKERLLDERIKRMFEGDNG